MDRIAHLQRLIDKFPDDTFSRHALALEWIKRGDDEQAKAIMVDLLEHFPEHTGTYYHLAKLLERIGEQQQALMIYEKGMEVAKRTQALHDRNELMGAYELLKDSLDV